MTDASPRFGLPFILPGQAQKELFHNEALLRIDMALNAAAEEGPRVAPPLNPLEGQCWIVGPGADGAWSGKDHALACWSAGGWRFVAPPAGTCVWNKAQRVPLTWDGAAWSGGELTCGGIIVDDKKVLGERQPAVPSPSGGTVIDAEARAAINAVIATLMSHGLTE
jgi:hypothetical protein